MSSVMTTRPARRSTRMSPLAHVLVWAYAAVMILPLYFLVVSAFKDNTEIFTSPFSLPTSLSVEQFVQAWSRVHLGQGLVNSLIVTVAAEGLTLTFAVCAAYALARSTGRVGALVERFFSLGLLIPAFAALVPTVLLAIALGLFHTRTFLIMYLSASALPLSIILLTQFMRAVPAELEESAMLDGAGRIRILVSIYIPVTAPGIVTVLILNFLTFWNEYLFALILAGPSPAARTAQVALPSLVSQTSTEYGVVLAGALITMIPVYAMYIVFQRRMEDALLQGATKG